MSLSDYRHKRKFDVTSEPRGKAPVKSGHRFVVQKHAASRLHYDFRLEVDGVLKSWAVPRGPSLDPAVKSLAVQVEDHPVDYADFEGTIPAGQYGGGTVMVWDRGTWEADGDDLSRSLKQGKATFRLDGEKLAGEWTLVRTKMQGEKNWLLIKKQDEFAVGQKQNDILKTAARSVLTGRDMSQIADNEKPVRRSKTKVKLPVNKKQAGEAGAASARHSAGAGLNDASAQTIADHLSKTPQAGKKRLDNFRPQLATLSETIPETDQWLHEVKLDGYRILARIGGGKVQLLTRRGLDWSDHFPKIAETVAELSLDNAILDGEVVALDENGVSDFQRLQNWMTQDNQAGFVYYVFDLPFAEKHDLTNLPLIERKKILAQVLKEHSPRNDGMIRYHDHIVGSGMKVLRQACSYAMEGVVSKNSHSPYVSRRSESWLKVKCLHNQEFVIAGYTKPSGERTGFGALLLGYYDDKDLVYCGRVGTGFTETSLKELTKRLKRLETDKCPYSRSPERSQLRGVTWLEPSLVAEISYATRTQDGLLRHAVFHGLREDKAARQVVLEKPISQPKADRVQAGSSEPIDRQIKAASMSKVVKKGKPAKQGRVQTDSVSPKRTDGEQALARISNPDRVVYREPELTKFDIATYFLDVARWMLPGVAGRPLTLLRCPQGSFAHCFFQKHLDAKFPEGIRGVEIAEDKKRDTYAVIDDEVGLLSLAQMNVLEVHLWPALADDVERPDRLIFDLDPGEKVQWSWVVDGAGDIRSVLKQVGLESFVRTSGGKGLHVVAPLNRKSASWHLLKEFASLLAHSLADQHPDRYVSTMTKSKRHGKVFIDYLRNQRGATAIASYSPRARVGACVATPISWRELNDELTNDDFTVENILQRLKRQRTDPWKGFDELDQALPNAAPGRTATKQPVGRSKSPTKRAAVKRAAVKRAAVKRAAVKRAAVKRATVKRATVKRATVKSATVKSARSKSTKATSKKGTSARRSTPKKRGNRSKNE